MIRGERNTAPRPLPGCSNRVRRGGVRFYGSPAYANADGKVLFFYQERAEFGARYDNLAFFDAAQLDDGSMWTTSFAITELSAADEVTIAALVRKATGN